MRAHALACQVSCLWPTHGPTSASWMAHPRAGGCTPIAEHPHATMLPLPCPRLPLQVRAVVQEAAKWPVPQGHQGALTCWMGAAACVPLLLCRCGLAGRRVPLCLQRISARS